MTLAALLVAVLIGLPRSPQAGLWSAGSVAGYGLEAELSQLRTTRELMTRRAAQRTALQGSVRALSQEIEALRRRAEQARSAIAGQHDAVRWQEQEQDRIVPRLAARVRTLERRRAQAARTLVDLAGLSRRRELAPELRTRLSAIGPALLDLLRSEDRVRAALTRQGDQVALDQQQRAARLPMLRAEEMLAQQRRRQLLDRRRHTLLEIAGLDAVLHRLARVSVPLARRMVVIEAAHRARLEPDARQPAHDRDRLQMAGAAVRGHALRSPDVARASPPGSARIMAAAGPRQRLASPRLEPDAALRVAALPPARPRTSGPLATMAPAAPVPDAMAVVALSSRTAPARLALPAPIRPSPELAMVRLDDTGRASGAMIAAAPGQRVAAPQDGRIVFADAFKSYGLLLIIEHDSEYHTLLWGFSKLRVGVGDKVTDGEIIGVMDVVDGVRPQLGVELRRRGQPINPLPWLAASSSKVRG